jgi:hypothetical protein
MTHGWRELNRAEIRFASTLAPFRAGFASAITRASY